MLQAPETTTHYLSEIELFRDEGSVSGASLDREENGHQWKPDASIVVIPLTPFEIRHSDVLPAISLVQ